METASTQRQDPALAQKSFWNKFWKFRVPQRAKHFAWRMLTDSLPTSANLRARTLAVSQTCPFCQEEDGTAIHLFFDCSFAERLWRTTGLRGIIEAARKPRAHTWMMELLRTSESKTTELNLMCCDTLWFQRNQRIFTDRKQEAKFLAAAVSLNLRNFQNANGWPERVSDDLQESSLLRPIPTGPRIHFDAGIADGKAGIGAIALSANGAFIRAIADSIPGITEPIYAEGRAMQLAIALARDLGLEDTQIVRDCLQLIRMCREEEEATPGIEALVVEIKAGIVEEHLGPPCWVSRDFNGLAHSLARHAKLNLNDRAVWDEFPAFLLSNDAGLIQ